MKEKVVSALKPSGLSNEEIDKLVEVPVNKELGDYAFPCFILAKTFKKNPVQIASELAVKLSSKDFEKIESKGPYINFFLKKSDISKDVLSDILKQKEKYGSSNEGKGKVIAIDLSAPNIAKPFGVGHLRSTIIGSSISNISEFLGYKTVKINYLGDWGTQFGKLIVGYKKFGSAVKLKKDPIKHLQELYVKVNASEEYEEAARLEFKKLEDGDKANLKLWKQFKDLSLEEFDRVYKMLGVEFDVISGESLYNNKMDEVVKLLKKKGLLVESEGAEIVDLDKYGLGACLIKKKDGATLYATRDITAAIDRQKKYKFDRMLYEVGSEQRLHFRQFFKVLELMGYDWVKNCQHIAHGLYLDSDGKKFSTRKGKTVFMIDILDETIALAKEEILKREKKAKDVDKRAKAIALAAIIYGDLRNYREHDMVFDIDRFVSFEGNTGPYLLYSYARAQSILKKSKSKANKVASKTLSESEKNLCIKLSQFPEVVQHAHREMAPNIIANYAYELSQNFNEFYASNQVIGSAEEEFRLTLVRAFGITLKNALALLGIEALERM